jgi:hypothetical protein
MSSGTRPQSAKKARVFTRADHPKPITLTERDTVALEELRRHRCLSGDQLRRLVFHCGPSMLRRRLRALYDNGLIDRVRVAAVPTRGVPPFLYTLSRSGAEVLPELLGRFRPDLLPDSGELAGVAGIQGAGLRFVTHRHVVNETHIALTEATRQRGYTIRWRHEEELMVGNPGEKRRAEVVRHPSLRNPMTFLPDAYCELGLSSGTSFGFFIEIDMANHPLRVWRDRARLYAAYADPRTALVRRRFGRETFRLLIVTTPDYRQRSRCENILRTIQETIGSTDMFLGTTFDCISQESILGPCWRTAEGSGRRVSLAPGGRVAVQPIKRGPVVVRPSSRANRATV